MTGPSAARSRRRRQALWLSAALVAALALAWSVLHKEEAHLILDGKSRVDGEMKVLVDGDEVYRCALGAPRREGASGEPGFLRKVSERIAGSDYESFQALIDVAAGRREIEVVVTPSTGEPRRNTLIADLKPGETRALKLVAGRSLGSSVSLRLD
jgi:hypothetical protein